MMMLRSLLHGSSTLGCGRGRGAGERAKRGGRRKQKVIGPARLHGRRFQHKLEGLERRLQEVAVLGGLHYLDGFAHFGGQHQALLRGCERNGGVERKTAFSKGANSFGENCEREKGRAKCKAHSSPAP